MNSRTALPKITQPSHAGRKFRLICFSGAALLLGLAVAAAYAKNLPNVATVSPAPKAAAMATEPMIAVERDVMAEAPMPVDLYRFALNALLVPLLDDANPPQWNDAALGHICEGATSVLIDGEPMVTGKAIPTKGFSVRWQMDRCAPLGPQAGVLSGRVELLVMPTPNGFSAIVMPNGLQVDSDLGPAWLQGPFAAETSLVAQVARGHE